MRKALKLITFSFFAMIGSPILTSIVFLINLLPIIGTVIWIGLLIHFARTVEEERKEYFSDINIAVFTACAYLPGVAASLALFLAMGSATDDPFGVGFLFGAVVFGSQVVFALVGMIFSLIVYLSVPKESKLPKLPYCPDQIDADEFFNDSKE